MKRFHPTIIIYLLVMGTAFSQNAGNNDFDMSQIYPVEGSHSYVGFSVKYMGYAMVKGRFSDFRGTIRYDESDIKKTSVSFAVDVNSIDTENDFRDRDLKSDNWFDAENFPSMQFVSQSIKETERGFDVIGELTIKSITKTVTINMDAPSGVLQDIRGDAQVIFNGDFTIYRDEFGVEGENWSKVKEGLTAVSKEVKVELIILGKQIKKNNFKNWVRNPERPQGKLYQLASSEGIDAALKAFHEMRTDAESQLKPGHLNTAAYMFLKEENYEVALQLFAANLEAFPDDANTYDSYAEALASAGKLKKAKKYYEMAVQKDPENVNAREILRHL